MPARERWRFVRSRVGWWPALDGRAYEFVRVDEPGPFPMRWIISRERFWDAG